MSSLLLRFSPFYSPKTSTFDEEQLERMENNKITAFIRRQAKLTPALSENIGRSWFKALEPEFNKPYFVKVSTVNSFGNSFAFSGRERNLME